LNRQAHPERVLVLAPAGRDAAIARTMLSEAGLAAHICNSLQDLAAELERGAGTVIFTEEAIRYGDGEPKQLGHWVAAQPPWSDFPFILLTERGGGLERNPFAKRYANVLGNVSFLERPFHPTTLISMVQTALRGRRRQYEARSRLEELNESEDRLRLALAAGRLGMGARRHRSGIGSVRHLQGKFRPRRRCAVQLCRSGRQRPSRRCRAQKTGHRPFARHRKRIRHRISRDLAGRQRALG
jgi:FixJ family two-component response regulator